MELLGGFESTRLAIICCYYSCYQFILSYFQNYLYRLKSPRFISFQSVKEKNKRNFCVSRCENHAAIEDLRRESFFGLCTPLVCNESGDYTRPVNFRKRYYRILEAAGIQRKGLQALRNTFATNLVNGVKAPDGSIKSLTPRQVADLLGHSTSQITEMYYVKRDNSRLVGVTDEFEL